MNENILLPYDLPEVLYKFHRQPIVNGRLTLTTAVPVTTSDVTGASTIYFTPYLGNYISLYSGNWNVYEFEETSLDISALTTATLYNVYGYWTGQGVALESSTTATATQDGRLVKSGDPTRLYLGSFYTSGAGTTEDSNDARFLLNHYNAEERPLYKQDATSHNYQSGTVRYFNNSTANKVEFISSGTRKTRISITGGLASADAGQSAVIYAVYDGTTISVNTQPFVTNLGIEAIVIGDSKDEIFTAGYHYVAACESSSSTNNALFTRYKLSGCVLA